MATIKNTTVNDTGYFMPPSGTTAQRPASPVSGMMRYNSTTNLLEHYSRNVWQNIAGIGNIASPANLTLYLDAGILTSYSGTGYSWYDLSGQNNTFLIDNSPNFTFDPTNNCFNMTGNGGISYTGAVTTSADATCVFIIKTTDTQSMFWMGDTGTAGQYFLGAYRVDNPYYSNNVSINTGINNGIYMNTTSIPNLYSYIRTGNWLMLEFKGCNFSSNTWPMFKFNKYDTFVFDNGSIAAIMIYNKTLTINESTQNYNYFGGRYGF
jgi:hypothetical protein